MENILKGCSSLKALELYGLDFTSEASSGSLFKTFPNLKYLNIKDVEFTDNVKQQFENFILAKNGMSICQNDDLDIKKNKLNKYRCCTFVLSEGQCENYIKIKYGSTVSYDDGFNLGREGVGITSIKNGNRVYKPNYQMTVQKNVEIEVSFLGNTTNLKDMFSPEIDSNMLNITSLDFSNFDLSLVKDMSSLFKGYTNLQAIDFSNSDTSSVTDMSNMFNGCTSLTSIDLTNFNNKALTNMSSMFEGCEQLQYAQFKNFDTSSVTDMSKLFLNCPQIIYLDISCFNMKNVTNSENMFSGEFNNHIYANLYNVEDPNGIITESNLNKVNDITVCQKDELITNENAIEIC